jgi:carbamoyltransferase
MIICGIKLTHDASVALIDNGKLIFCIEAEKIGNASRYSEWNDFKINYLVKILSDFGYEISSIDKFVFDGWGDFKSIINNDYQITYKSVILENDEEMKINLQRYGMLVENENIFEFNIINPISDKSKSVISYMHVTGHLMSAYCTSPFSVNKEDSYLLVWDGGMCPQLFYLFAKEKKIELINPLFFLLGSCYGALASNYEPFNHLAHDDLSIAGKLMAYIALGKKDAKTINAFKNIFLQFEDRFELHSEKALMSKLLTSEFLKEIVIYGEIEEIAPKNLMCNFHYFIEELLIDKLSRLIDINPNLKRNFCFVGGCALNIKWNSKLRSTNFFDNFWVPPFPNDSGSAIGAACCEMFLRSDKINLDWTVYSGPKIIREDFLDSNWIRIEISVSEIAEVLYYLDEPIVLLNDRAELGPRSLGNRSIVASPINPNMKEVLNKIKGREHYRPIAPICIEDFSSDFFHPGVSDPYMLYDHFVKLDKRNLIPAVCHLDFSARLQTVNQIQNPILYSLLLEFKDISGIPILCNTSANFNGSGFFPDIKSVMQWNKVDLIWSNGSSFVKIKSRIFDYLMSKKNLNV